MPIIGVLQERITATKVRGARSARAALGTAPFRPLLEDPDMVLLWIRELDGDFRRAVGAAAARVANWRVGDMRTRPAIVRAYTLLPDDPRLRCR